MLPFNVLFDRFSLEKKKCIFRPFPAGRLRVQHQTLTGTNLTTYDEEIVEPESSAAVPSGILVVRLRLG